jgi:hypothetical protein
MFYIKKSINGLSLLITMNNVSLDQKPQETFVAGQVPFEAFGHHVG